MAGPCRAGDVLGLVDGEVVVIGARPRRGGRDVLDRMLAGGGELVTLVLGESAAAAWPRSWRPRSRTSMPGVEVTVLRGAASATTRC